MFKSLPASCLLMDLSPACQAAGVMVTTKNTASFSGLTYAFDVFILGVLNLLQVMDFTHSLPQPWAQGREKNVSCNFNIADVPQNQRSCIHGSIL